jgi:hypothetical protein
MKKENRGDYIEARATGPTGEMLVATILAALIAGVLSIVDIVIYLVAGPNDKFVSVSIMLAVVVAFAFVTLILTIVFIYFAVN